MSYLIKNAARKLADIATQKMYEVFLEKMIERGYDETNVKKIGGEVKLEVDDVEKTGYSVDFIEADTMEEYAEKYIDATIDKPKYTYDEDYKTEGQERDPSDYNQMIPPGSRVDIEGLKEWVRSSKIDNVGRKPPYMTPEEWDNYIVGMKPIPGSYSKNESWGNREFPYGNQYKYRDGPIDDIDTADPVYKGWTKAGHEDRGTVV